MREILFKGKTYKEGLWIEGSLIIDERGNYYIGKYIESKRGCSYYCTARQNGKPVNRFIGIGFALVIPETVGQFTGLTVPNGKIFEHDIVTAKFKSNGARFNFTVKYSEENGCYVFDNGSVKVTFNAIRSVRIIGNIHDNSELLEANNEKFD